MESESKRLGAQCPSRLCSAVLRSTALGRRYMMMRLKMRLSLGSTSVRKTLLPTRLLPLLLSALHQVNQHVWREVATGTQSHASTLKKLLLHSGHCMHGLCEDASAQMPRVHASRCQRRGGYEGTVAGRCVVGNDVTSTPPWTRAKLKKTRLCRRGLLSCINDNTFAVPLLLTLLWPEPPTTAGCGAPSPQQSTTKSTRPRTAEYRATSSWGSSR